MKSVRLICICLWSTIIIIMASVGSHIATILCVSGHNSKQEHFQALIWRPTDWTYCFPQRNIKTMYLWVADMVQQSLETWHLLSRTDVYYCLYIHLHTTIIGRNEVFTLTPLSCEKLGLVRVHTPNWCARRPFTCSFQKTLMHQILIPAVQL